jgi:hypothetical protein
MSVPRLYESSCKSRDRRTFPLLKENVVINSCCFSAGDSTFHSLLALVWDYHALERVPFPKDNLYINASNANLVILHLAIQFPR